MLHTEVRTQAGEALVVRRAAGAGVARLRATGERLRRAAHPGVVQVVSSAGDDESWELQLAHAGRPLDAVGSLDVAAAARVLAGVASILADLHDLGVVHGRLDAGHVLLGPHGHPVLCGFGPDDGGSEPADDVAAVGALLVELLGRDDELEPIPDRRWRRHRSWTGWQRRSLLLVADQACAEPATRRPTARRLAAAISEAVPADDVAHPPPRIGADRLALVGAPEADGAPAGSRVRRPSVLLPLVGLALAVVLGARLVGEGGPPQVERKGAAPQVAPSPPRVEHLTETSEPATSTTAAASGGAGGEEVRVEGNVVTRGERRYAVGAPGDRVVVGDWDCDGVVTPAVLRLDTGSVFAFTEWAVTTPLAAVALQTVPGAVDVRAVVAGGGCHRLEVVQGDGRAVSVPVVVS